MNTVHKILTQENMSERNNDVIDVITQKMAIQIWNKM